MIENTQLYFYIIVLIRINWIICIHLCVVKLDLIPLTGPYEHYFQSICNFGIMDKNNSSKTLFFLTNKPEIKLVFSNEQLEQLKQLRHTH